MVVFQPAQVRAYAKFHLQRAKNDKIDAALIAACTAAVKKIHPPPDARLLPFAEHLTMIDQIGEDITLLKNRLETCRNAAYSAGLEGRSRPAQSDEGPSSRPWWRRSASIAISPSGSI